MPRPTIERILVIGVIAFVVSVLANYELCFQKGETLLIVSDTVRNGPSLSWSDVALSLDTDSFDSGQDRPRFLSHFAFILTTKIRLALWDFVVPHPSFSPFWLLILASPVLLFRFLAMEFSTRAAWAGVSIYLMSPGLLSSLGMLFRPAKPVTAIVLIVALYYAAATLRGIPPPAPGDERTPRLPVRKLMPLLLLLTAGPFIDETSVFSSLVMVVWCPFFFWPRAWTRTAALGCVRNWLLWMAPVLASSAIILWLIPRFVTNSVGVPFDVVTDGLEAMSWGRFDMRHLVWQAGNLFIPQLLPWKMAGATVPVSAGPVLPVAALSLLALGASAISRIAWRNRRVRPGYVRLACLAGAFALFQTAVFKFHAAEVPVTGFYYGSMFSVLLASLGAAAYGALPESRNRLAAWAGRAALVWVLVVSGMNFVTLSAGWRAHRNAELLDELDRLPGVGRHGDWSGLPAAAAARFQRAMRPGASIAEQYLAEDTAPPGAGPAFRETRAIWERWRAGRVDYLGDRPVALRDVWLAVELALKGEAR